MRSLSRLALPVGVSIFALAQQGCGDGGAADAKALTGTYDIMIESMGKMDSDVMNVSQGVDGTVLLDFVAGISQVRAKVTGTGKLAVPSQTVHVEHSTGAADGVAAGMGSISVAGAVDITLSLAAAGADGGVGGPSYHLTGTRR